jgi:hypothetical protein
MVLSPIDKIKLGRAHKFGHWLEEGITSLVDGVQELTREELATLGWETAALIFWIKDRLSRAPRTQIHSFSEKTRSNVDIATPRRVS